MVVDDNDQAVGAVPDVATVGGHLFERRKVAFGDRTSELRAAKRKLEVMLTRHGREGTYCALRSRAGGRS